ncbi:DUF2157 domain-containing protein [Erythrobacter sp. JK5]|uniref:DUF2157 domain-containing protein n=1 Tax=Erythrobacter sp. JK5 TaxID=2829500 RepID=UPI001BADF329|nr:DUF2157 domain-containing protein [Erythrobacter sp. JK5]QUL37073.1 DUF2157 domain-containing protein [Erythrobacter sp. JK5]
MSTRKIEAWHGAGLIDAETRARLIAYEDEHARPLALWAVFGIGALAIGLGLISVVAANWDDIPGRVRLAIHLALIVGALAALFLRERPLRQSHPWAVEALLFVAAALGLTFFGHLGQVYQTSSPLWEPLAIWLVLFGPILLLLGRSWLTAAVLVGGAIYCAWEFSYAQDELVRRIAGQSPPYIGMALVTALPLFFAPLGAWMRGRGDRPDFWRRIEQLALVYAVIGASLSCAIASADGYSASDDVISAASQYVRAVTGIVAGLLVVVARPGISGRMSGAIVIGAGLTIAFARVVNDQGVFAALLLMVLWVGIATAALQAGWRWVFQAAVAVIALRLIILSFELASDLLLSGFGLILSGVLILCIAFVAVRVSRRFAPPAEVDGEARN